MARDVLFGAVCRGTSDSVASGDLELVRLAVLCSVRDNGYERRGRMSSMLGIFAVVDFLFTGFNDV
jgi:hypothetical protein